MRALIAVGLMLLAACATPTQAQTAPEPFTVDGAAIAACLESAEELEAMRACGREQVRACFDDPGAETTVGMIRCHESDLRAWQAILDAAQARAAQTYPARQGMLAAASETWTLWRTQECDYQAALYEGGSLARVLRAACHAELTAERAIHMLWQEQLTE